MASNSDSVLSNIVTPIFSETAKIIGIFHQLYVAGERVGDVLKTIRHITRNVENVRRLRRLNADHLSTHDLTWIDALISDTADAIGELATLVESARVDKETRERISLWNKGVWVAYYGPKVKEKYQKLTMCHQSLLSVFPYLFNNRSGLASVLEETKGDDQQPSDATMMKWLSWQDQRQRRKSSTNLKIPTLSQRPISISSSFTDMTLSSVVGSDSSESTGPADSEASWPKIGTSDPLASNSQSCSPIIATISPQTHPISSGSYHEKNSSGFYTSPHSSGSPDLVTETLDLTNHVFDNGSEDNYDPQSAPHGAGTDDGNDDHTSSTKHSNIDDCADGLPDHLPLGGSDVLCDSVSRLQISSFDAQSTKASQSTAIVRRNEEYIDPAEAIRPGWTFAMPQNGNGSDSPTDAVHEARPETSLPFSGYFPLFDFERPTRLTSSSFTGQSSELGSFEDPEDGAEAFLEEGKPPIDRAHSDTYIQRYPVRSRTELSQSGRAHVASGGGRSLSTGQLGARRGGRSWISYHSSRSDLRQADGWGEG